MVQIHIHRSLAEQEGGGALPNLPQHRSVSTTGVVAVLPKGGAAVSLPPSVLVLDTGQPEVPALDARTPRTQADLDDLYRETIRRGIIDHHGIDATVTVAPGLIRHSTTGMIALAPELILAQIKDRGVNQITAHADSDLDSLAACYLAQSLREHQVLPTLTQALAHHVDQVDFGLYRVPAERYSESLAGVIGALKRVHDETARVEVGSIFGDGTLSREEKSKRAAEVFEHHQRLLIEDAFAVFDGCEILSKAGLLDVNHISGAIEKLSAELRNKIEKGQRSALQDLHDFEREYERAIRGTGSIVDRTGKVRQVPVVIFEQTGLHPLLVTNLSYMKEAPDAIIAVYAGSSRKAGDVYDIGIKPETAQAIFTLHSLAVALSEVEGELRKPLLAELESKREAGIISDEERKRYDVLTTPRKGFEHLGIGDPTVCVAGGSLVAASTNSMMTGEAFVRAVKRAVSFAEV